MMRIGCALVVICVAGLGVAESAALGAFAGRNGAIAFVSDRRGADFDIWAMNPDGSGLVALTSNSKADDFAPNWRADGRKLAFNSDRVTFANPEGDHEIFVADADGSHVRQITFNALDDEDPAWSPDGSRIAFATGSRPDPGTGRLRPLHDESRRQGPTQHHELARHHGHAAQLVAGRPQAGLPQRPGR